MTYKDFRDNKEIGRLIQFAYDLHKRDFTLLPCLPYFEFYTGHGLYYGKILKMVVFMVMFSLIIIQMLMH